MGGLYRLTPDKVHDIVFTCPEDPDDDPLEVHLQVSDIKDFSRLIVDADSSVDETNWQIFTGTDWDDMSDVTGTGIVPDAYQGNRISFTVYPAVQKGVFIRVRFRKEGETSWGTWTGDKVS